MSKIWTILLLLLLTSCGVQPVAIGLSTTPAISVTSINSGVAFDVLDQPPLVINDNDESVQRPLAGVSYPSMVVAPSVFSGISAQ